MFVDVQGIKIFVKEAGSGQPVLFLHGNPDSADLWDDTVARLQDHYRCICPDLPGFARSAAPADFDCSLDNLARFLDRLVTALEITEPLHLVVFDFGGPYGLAWATQHPAKVKTFTILNTVFYSDYKWHLWAKIWRTPLLGELSMLALNYPVFSFSMRLGGRGIEAAKIKQAYAHIKPSTKRMVLRLYRATSPAVFKRWEDELGKLTATKPTQVIWGQRDPYIAKKFAARFGTDQVHFLDCGHFVPYEAPQELASKLEEFLKRS